MGFLRGVITGLGIAAGAAAWYMSRAGQEFRERYRVDRKLGEFGDEIEVRTRDVRGKVGAQVAEVRSQAMGGSGSEGAISLDDATAAAAEEAAEMAAGVEAKAATVKKTARDEAMGSK
jgi:hypothetical protein